MNRDEMIAFMIEELKKIPNRDRCKTETEEHMGWLAAEVDFEKLERFLAIGDLGLDIGEVPSNFYTEVYLYFVMAEEYTSQYFFDFEIWNLEDEATCDFLANAKEILQIYKEDHFTGITVAEFLEYARSDRPDL